MASGDCRESPPAPPPAHPLKHPPAPRTRGGNNPPFLGLASSRSPPPRPLAPPCVPQSTASKLQHKKQQTS